MAKLRHLPPVFQSSIVNRQSSILQFGPLPLPFPNTQREGKRHAIAEFALDHLADILNGGIVEKLVKRMVVVGAQSLSQRVLEFGKIDDHAGFVFSFDDDFNLIGMAMQRAAFMVSGQEMCTVDIFDHP